MLTATCHCGAVEVAVPRRPRSLTNCNCSLCRRYGVLWAYYRDPQVRLLAAPGATEDYVWGAARLKFTRCKACGCVMQWRHREAGPKAWAGVNARNFEPAALGDVRIRLLDGADTWKYVG